MEEIPIECLYYIFDKLPAKDLNALRNTSNSMLYAVDDYVWNRCTVMKRQHDSRSKIISIITKALEAITENNRSLVSVLMLKIVWPKFEFSTCRFYTPVFVVLQHKIWSTIFKRGIATLEAMGTEMRNRFIFYHHTVFKIINELLKIEYTSDEFLTDDLGISFEKEFDSCYDIPFIVKIIFAIFDSHKHKEVAKERTHDEKVKIIMKLKGPLNVSEDDQESAEGNNFDFLYHLELHRWNSIREIFYERKFNSSKSQFRPIPFFIPSKKR